MTGPTAAGATAATDAGPAGLPAAPRPGSEWAVAVVAALVVLGPAALPGALLRYDLVAVPGPVLGTDALGLGDRFARAVPWDAVVAVLARVLPDAWVVQPLAVLALAAAGAGAARLARAAGPGRWVALLVAVWNPFVAEQLGIGHVPHLLAYGALPWVVVTTRAAVRAPSTARVLGAGAVLAAGSVTPGGGALCWVVAVGSVLAALGGARTGARAGARAGAVSAADAVRSVRAGLGVVALAATVQLPWVLAGAGHPGRGRTDPASATLFAVRGRTPFGPFVDALALGGMWNADPVPPSRHTVLAAAGVVLLLGLAGLGAGPALRRAARPDALAAAAVTAGCYLVAVLPALPGGGALLRLLVSHVPGAGLLRDGHRWLAAPALLLAALAGAGAQRLAAGAARAAAGRPVAAGLPAAVLVLVAGGVVAVLPDGGLGLGGALRPRTLPASWSLVAQRVAAADDRARVLVLPWQPFRLFAWSGPAPVLDPLPRTLPRQVLVSDRLRVGDAVLAPEGPAAAAVERALADGRLDPAEATALAVGWVVVERGTPGPVPALPAGTAVVDAPEVLLLRLPLQPDAPEPGAVRAGVVLGGHAAWALVLLGGLPAAVATVRGRRRRGSGAPSGSR